MPTGSALAQPEPGPHPPFPQEEWQPEELPSQRCTLLVAEPQAELGRGWVVALSLGAGLQVITRPRTTPAP